MLYQNVELLFLHSRISLLFVALVDVLVEELESLQVLQSRSKNAQRVFIVLFIFFFGQVFCLKLGLV